MSGILDRVNSPADLKSLSLSELELLAAEIRETLVETVSANGGHLASNLGVVELTIALHRIFESPKDKIIWDVGHQSYTHKLLTGRKDAFTTLRQFGGISGFTSRTESEHDSFGAGHASTSISAALGMAVARDMAKKDHDVIAVIGDGAITGGMAFEALNQAGHLGSKMIVILNDNGMSISPTVGALAKMLSRVRTDTRYRKAKETGWKMVKNMPFSKYVHSLVDQMESGVKGFVMPTTLWEEFGFTYLGPVDGHNIKELEAALTQAKEYTRKPILLHVATTKGKGYQPAEGNAVYFHGVSAKNAGAKSALSYSEVAAQTIHRMVKEDPRIVVITPAMPEGSCLTSIQAEFPKRVFDVGICEQHAVTFAAGLATQGFLPIITIYSTFLQRAYDQMIHDVCLQDLPIVFAIDRSGIVGDDGKTHQGALDISYLSLIPNLTISAPKDENELQHLLYTAVKSGHPAAVRYPRGNGQGVLMDSKLMQIPIGSGELLKSGESGTIIAIGATVAPALQAAVRLMEIGVDAAVINARFAKPLDAKLILDMAVKTGRIITVEENALWGGFGSSVLRLLQQEGMTDIQVKNIGLPDEFIEHGTQTTLRHKYGLDADGIFEQAAAFFPARAKQRIQIPGMKIE